ncbi:MAG: flagellar biosynthesis protein FlhF, partial [Pseudothermotoga sp.]|nr:flagellar biosynthesis protein FlhF [Pseudothermotoga sp.]
MKMKKYIVNDIKEALEQIKNDLGEDAIILSTRSVKKGG